MQDYTRSLCRMLGRLCVLALMTAFLTLSLRVQAQSGGPLRSWRDDVSEQTFAPNPAAPNGDGIVTGTQIVATPVSGTPSGTFKALAAGAYHAVAIRADGTLLSWGNDGTGQIAGTPTGTFKAVAAGSYHSIAIRTDGTLISWGDDSASQVSKSPTTGTYIAVAAGEFHSVAIRTDGSLIAWGLDEDKQVSGAPTTGTFKAVAAGNSFCVALRSDGTLVAWGDDTDHVVKNIPKGMFTAVAAGSQHAVAIRSDGTLAAWGNDVVVGDDGEPLSATVVSSAPKTGTFVAVAAGETHSIALRSDGTLVAWGSDDHGQVSAVPTGAFQAIAAGGNQTMAIVGYSWSGFLPPINSDGFSVFNAGSTVPVKFQLTGLSTGITNLVATLTYAPVTNGVVGAAQNATPSGGSSAFRYDATSGQYIFNWSTKRLAAGTYQLQVNLGDGLTTHMVNISLR